MEGHKYNKLYQHSMPGGSRAKELGRRGKERAHADLDLPEGWQFTQSSATRWPVCDR